MHKNNRQKIGYNSKYAPTAKKSPISYQSTQSPQKYNYLDFSSVQSRYSKHPYLKENSSASSSRIAEEAQPPQNDYQSFQESILQKVQCIEQQTNELLQQKEKELYYMKLQLRKSQEKLRQTEQALKVKNEQLWRVTNEAKMNTKQSNFYCTDESQNMRMLVNENEKLRQSLKLLIDQKNENSKRQQKIEYINSCQIQQLKKEACNLHKMVAEMQKSITNCPSCFAFKRQVQQIRQAYDCLLKEHSELRKKKNDQENSLLNNITQKIMENHNILRENGHLKEQIRGKAYYFRPKSQKTKEVVAKRCRTLTDNF